MIVSLSWVQAGDVSRNNRLVIPNASLSILEVDTGNDRSIEDVKVIELTNAKYLDTVNMYDDWSQTLSVLFQLFAS